MKVEGFAGAGADAAGSLHCFSSLCARVQLACSAGALPPPQPLAGAGVVAALLRLAAVARLAGDFETAAVFAGDGDGEATAAGCSPSWGRGRNGALWCTAAAAAFSRSPTDW